MPGCVCRDTGDEPFDADLPPAPFEITGVATFPDGTTKPLLLQLQADAPAFSPSVTVVPTRNKNYGDVFAAPISFVTE